MASLQSPLLAILKSRRVREELRQQESQRVAVVANDGKENLNQQPYQKEGAKKKMSKSGGEHKATGDGVSACETPPDFTPRRRR